MMAVNGFPPAVAKIAMADGIVFCWSAQAFETVDEVEILAHEVRVMDLVNAGHQQGRETPKHTAFGTGPIQGQGMLKVFYQVQGA